MILSTIGRGLDSTYTIYWLLDYLPRSDDFREDIKDAIKKLEPVTTKPTTAQVRVKR